MQIETDAAMLEALSLMHADVKIVPSDTRP
jgi:hypothetical protein